MSSEFPMSQSAASDVPGDIFDLLLARLHTMEREMLAEVRRQSSRADAAEARANESERQLDRALTARSSEINPDQLSAESERADTAEARRREAEGLLETMEGRLRDAERRWHDAEGRLKEAQDRVEAMRSGHAGEIERYVTRIASADARILELQHCLEGANGAGLPVETFAALDGETVEADQIVLQARKEAQALLADAGAHLIDMGTAYREAIVEARRTLDELASALASGGVPVRLFDAESGQSAG